MSCHLAQLDTSSPSLPCSLHLLWLPCLQRSQPLSQELLALPLRVKLWPLPQQSYLLGVPTNSALPLQQTPVHKPKTFPAWFVIRNIGWKGGWGAQDTSRTSAPCQAPVNSGTQGYITQGLCPPKAKTKNSRDAHGKLTITGLCPALGPLSSHPPSSPITHPFY